jgi:Glycosyltransferases involved in cell wall biogenesis
MLGISIIIPCYNTGVFLKEAINSILEQPIIHDYEIILVDDASNDYETL